MVGADGTPELWQPTNCSLPFDESSAVDMSESRLFIVRPSAQ